MELVPLARVYGMEYSDNYTDGVTSAWNESSKEQAMIGGTFLCGQQVVDVGVYVRPAPDFCGGGLIHSPWVNVRDKDGPWGYPLPGRNFDQAADHAPEERYLHSLFDAAEQVEKSGLDAEDYGYACLAAGVAQYMLHRSWMGVVGTGVAEESGSPMALLVEAFDGLRHTAGSYYATTGYNGTLAWGAERMQYRRENEGVESIDTLVTEGPEYLNPNSQHMVRVYLLNITGSTRYDYGEREYDLDDDDEYYDDYGEEYGRSEMADHYAIAPKVGAVDQRSFIRTNGVALEAVGTSGVLAACIQRSNWRNG